MPDNTTNTKNHNKLYGRFGSLSENAIKIERNL